MKYYLDKILQSGWNFLVPLFVFFAPMKGILITVLMFIIFDTITGIWKSKKLNIPIRSHGLTAIAAKMVLYVGSILLTYLMDVYILGDILKSVFSVEHLLIKVLALVLVYIEIKSINENYEAVKGINLWTEFKNLLYKVKEIKKDVDDITKKDN